MPTKKVTKRTRAVSAKSDPIAAYGRAQSRELGEICGALRKLIDAALPDATSKVWHGSPVWFSGPNPIVGYSTAADCVRLLFWNGKVIAGSASKPVGKYGAAQLEFRAPSELDERRLRGWLELARTNVFDSQGFFAKLRAARK
jgi:hypothetical protein